MADVEKITLHINNAIHSNLVELSTIWDYVGFEESERIDRLTKVCDRLRSQLDQSIAEENAYRLDVEHQIECQRREVADLCHHLRLPAFLPERSLSSSAMLKVLQQKATELYSLKQQRCSKYHCLRTRIVQLSQLMNEPHATGLERVVRFPALHPHTSSTTPNGDHPSDKFNDIPDERQLQSLLNLHDEVNRLYQPLLASYTALLDDISRIATDISYQPENDRELEFFKSNDTLSRLCRTTPPAVSTPGVVRKVGEMSPPPSGGNRKSISNDGVASSSSSSHEPVIDKDVLSWLSELRLKLVKEKARLVGICDELRTYLRTMWRRLDKPESEQNSFLQQHTGYQPHTLEALQEEVDRCQQLKWEKLDSYVNRLSSEAFKLARLCCMDARQLIQLSPSQDSSDPEQLAHHLETVLEQLNQTYNMYRPVYECVAAYEEQWGALSEIETRLRDPTILSNRGGILLKTEKEKKRIQKELQRTEQDALDAIEQYEIKFERPFLLANGQTFKDYVNNRLSIAKPSRESSRVRRSQLGLNGSNSRPFSTYASSGPPGAPT